jgi:hypothetical protein
MDYRDQIEALCAREGVDFAAACRAAGLAQSTIDRWDRGDMNMGKISAERITKAVEELKK